MKIFPDKTQDEEFKDLGALGWTGSLNDRQFQYLRDAGYSGSLTDMLAAAKGGGEAPAVTPADFSPLVWLDQTDSSATSTVGAYEAGASVDAITNKGSASFDVAQTNGATQPVLTSVGGVNLLEYSGSQVLFVTDADGAPSFSGAWTAAFVFDLDDNGSARRVFLKIGEYGLRITFPKNFATEPGTGNGDIPAYTPSGLHIFVVQSDASGNVTMWIRGSTNDKDTSVTGGAAVSGSSDFCLGAFSSSGVGGVDGVLGDFVLWDRVVSLSDLNNLLANYHASKYGITWTDIT